jgi:hypothetical protein
VISNSYKIWIILFVIINLLLLIWSLGNFKFFEDKLTKKDDIVVIEPENQFKKSLPPKDESFPNEKSKVWGAFENKKRPEQVLQRNTEEENKNNKIENNKELDSARINKENKLIDDEQSDVSSSNKNKIL